MNGPILDALTHTHTHRRAPRCSISANFDKIHTKAETEKEVAQYCLHSSTHMATNMSAACTTINLQ